jgi:hypothetical protein
LTLIERLRDWYIGRTINGVTITGVFYDKDVQDAYYFTYDIDYTSEIGLRVTLESIRDEFMKYWNVRTWYYIPGEWMLQYNMVFTMDNIGRIDFTRHLIDDNGNRRKYQ